MIIQKVYNESLKMFEKQKAPEDNSWLQKVCCIKTGRKPYTILATLISKPYVDPARQN